jgi:hypothetical protein
MKTCRAPTPLNAARKIALAFSLPLAEKWIFRDPHVLVVHEWKYVCSVFEWSQA